MAAEFLSATILLILVIDPFGNVPLVAAALAATPAERRARVVLEAGPGYDVQQREPDAARARALAVEALRRRRELALLVIGTELRNPLIVTQELAHLTGFLLDHGHRGWRRARDRLLPAGHSPRRGSGGGPRPPPRDRGRT